MARSQPTEGLTPGLGYNANEGAMEQGTSKKLEPTTQATGLRGQDTRVNGKTSGVRTASKQQFDSAHRKTSALHAGLFRRLAK
jgi:hypothetical protein